MAHIALRWPHHDPESRHGFSVGLSRGLARLLGWFTEWSTDDDIARFVERSGGRLTDELEREIANRAIGGFRH